MTEGAGYVAFVSHLTVFQSTRKNNDLNPGNDFQLLLPDGLNASRCGKLYYVRRFTTTLIEGAAFIVRANARNFSVNNLFGAEI